MQSRNARTVSAFYKLMAERDQAGIIDLLDPAIEIWQSETLPWGGAYRGVQGFVEYAQNAMQHVDLTIDVDRLIDAGDDIVVAGRSKGRAWQSEARIDVPVVHIWKVKKGRLLRLDAHADTGLMLRALNADLAEVRQNI